MCLGSESREELIDSTSRETLNDGVVQVLECVDADSQQQEQDETECEAENTACVHLTFHLTSPLPFWFHVGGYILGIDQLTHHADTLFDFVGRLRIHRIAVLTIL